VHMRHLSVPLTIAPSSPSTSHMVTYSSTEWPGGHPNSNDQRGDAATTAHYNSRVIHISVSVQTPWPISCGDLSITIRLPRPSSRTAAAAMQGKQCSNQARNDPSLTHLKIMDVTDGARSGVPLQSSSAKSTFNPKRRWVCWRVSQTRCEHIMPIFIGTAATPDLILLLSVLW
jgi:hypothetical protein